VSEFTDRLATWLADQRGVPALVESAQRISTGHSRAMWKITTSDAEQFVVRIEQGGVFGSSGTVEFEFMRAAHRNGLPVAEALFNEPTGTILGQPFFVMKFVEHVAVGREERNLSSALALDFIRQLDALHRSEATSVLTAPVDIEQVTHLQIDRWLSVARLAERRVPLLEEAAAWLHRHAPPARRVGIVHGDPGPGNFLHDGERVVAITDWEFAHLGDPMEDWVFLIHMRGAKTMPTEQWRTLIERTVGVTVRDADLRYWSAFNLFKGSCANLTCRSAFTSANPAPNMAIIGTALHLTFLNRLTDIVGG
jgi:aminoglycoside phosphotransferase (APT) family kinase protein